VSACVDVSYTFSTNNQRQGQSSSSTILPPPLVVFGSSSTRPSDPVQLPLFAGSGFEGGPSTFTNPAHFASGPADRDGESSSRPDQLPAFTTSLFPNNDIMTAYLNAPTWMPSAYDYGTPTTNDDLLVNVAKIYDALIDLREVWDDVRYPELFDKFRSDGAWGKDPAKIELMARRIVAEVRRFHVNESIAMTFKSDSPLPVKPEDQEFTFPQRIH
jgi:hypothetical protein